jgi:hypothetical protein
MDNRYQAIMTQPRPRQVRLSKRGKSSLRLLSAVLVVAEIWIFAALYLRWLRLHSLTELWQNNSLASVKSGAHWPRLKSYFNFAFTRLPVLVLSLHRKSAMK